MYNFTKYVFGVMLVVASFTLQAQTVLFSETFDADTTLPVGWQEFNLDGGLVASQLQNIGLTFHNGWQIVDTVVFGEELNATRYAASTSYYVPADTANDWLVTPAINITNSSVALQWRSRALDVDFPDGYQIRVATTLNVDSFLANPPLYSTNAEAATFTTRSASLAAYSGKTVYIAFVNNAFDKFVLLLDDIKVLELPSDSRIDSTSFPSRYSAIPLSQVAPLTLAARVENNGGTSVTNVAVKFEVIKASSGNTVVFSNTSTTVATLAAAAKTAMLTPTASYTPNDTGVYVIRYSVQMTEAQGTSTGDTSTFVLFVNDSMYARDLFVFTNTGLSALSIGDTTNNKVLGQHYEANRVAIVKDIEFVLLQPTIGDTLRAVVHSVAGNGLPTGRLGQSALYTVTEFDTAGVILQLPLETPVTVNQGTRFFVGVTEGKFSDGVTLGTMPGIYTANQHLINYNGWQSLEAFPAQFRRAFIVRPYLGNKCHTASATSTNATCGQSDGSATVNVTAGTYAGAYTYTWSAGGSTTNTITNQPANVYSVTVSDGKGCSTVTSVAISTVNGPTIDSLKKTDVTCFGASSGSATVYATGSGTLTYDWVGTGQTTQTATGLAAGSYTVAVKDAQNCLTTQSVTLTQPNSAVVGSATKVLDAVCNGELSGKAVASGTGGTGPYSYAWSSSPAQNTDSLLAVAAGTYTVTITDSKGCTATSSVTLTQPSALQVTIVNKTDANQGQNNGTAAASTSGGTAPYTYTWPGSAVTGPAVVTLAAGNYTVTVKDSKGCTATTTFTIGTINSIGEDNATFSTLNVFPVPASTNVTVKADLKNSEAVTIEMADVTGKVVYTSNEAATMNHNININVTKFAKGVYTLSVKAKSGRAYQQVIVE